MVTLAAALQGTGIAVTLAARRTVWLS